MILAWALALAILALLIYGFHPGDRWRLRRIPGPRQYWMIGNLLDFAKEGDHNYFNRLHKQYGSIFKVWILGSNVVVATPELCRQICLHNSSRLQMPNLYYGKYWDFDNAIILWLKGERARTVRSAWHPMFYSGTLEGIVGLMHQAADSAVQRLSAAAKSKDPIDVSVVLSQMSLQVIAQAAFGIDVSNPDAVLREFDGKPYTVSQLIADIRTAFRTTSNSKCQYTQLSLLFPFAVPLWRWLANILPSESHAAALDLRNRMIPYVEGLIKDHAAVVKEQDDIIKTLNPTGDGKERRGVAAGSFLDILVRTKHKSSGASLTDIEICNQAFAMLMVGLETTSSALAFATYFLAQNPDKAEKLAAEIRSQPDNPGYSDLTEGFPYTEAVIREAIRLYPPGSYVIRAAEKDMQLGGYKVQKNQLLIGAIYAIHHDASVWPDPEAFIPERHLSADAVGAPTQPHAWLGFGEGARNCVGGRLAMLEAKLALVHLFRHHSYRLTPGQVPLEIVTTLTLGPKNGVWVTVHGPTW
ncbi:hypothetical protein WJX73_004212 [Symbiochloris irregularis]|uniref:Cytochrome P450 n=1 Tax=Symbiochloris irregularis TaxID=706552 RepID=A0AAW1P0A0_9CHLO